MSLYRADVLAMRDVFVGDPNSFNFLKASSDARRKKQEFDPGRRECRQAMQDFFNAGYVVEKLEPSGLET